MFLPLKDDNPLEVIPFQWVTVPLIGLLGLVFLGQVLRPADVDQWMFDYGLVPVRLFGSAGDEGPLGALVPLTLVTYMFLHVDVFHLLGNGLYLWVFGDNVEDALGHARFLLLFLVCGILGGLAQAVATPDSARAVVGASGAVSGVLGGYLVLHPRVRVLALLLKFIPVRLPVLVLFVGWITLQAVGVLTGATGVAFYAHGAGFLAGAVLVPLLRRASPPVAEPPPTLSEEIES